MPRAVRRNYSREMAYALCFPVALTVIEGSIISVIAKNAFEGAIPARQLNFIVALLMAAPEFANITSFFWAAAAHGRPKIRFINSLQVATLGMIVAIAALPRTGLGIVALAGVVMLARVFMAGVLTLRSTVWSVNYHRSERGHATGKFATVTVLVVAVAGYSLGSWLDHDPGAFRFLIPSACAIGLVGVLSYSRIRVRRHKGLLRSEAGHGDHERPSFNPLAVPRVLRADAHYAWFQLFMFLLGTGNIMVTAPLVITLRDQFQEQYGGGILATSTIPMLAIPLAIPFWARLLRARHVVVFRSIHSWVFVVAQAIILSGTVLHRMELILIGAAVLGVGFAGGTLAWNLGHLDFAPPRRATQYMGVHVTLNGVRGLIAPFLAVGIYEGLEAEHPGSGAWVFAFSIIPCIVGAVGFRWLSIHMGERALTPKH